MHLTPSRIASLSLILCLTGCGQTGRLFLRLPETAVPSPLYAPPVSTQMTPIVALPGGTTAAPVSASAPQSPAATTRAAPAAATRLAPGASTHP